MRPAQFSKKLFFVLLLGGLGVSPAAETNRFNLPGKPTAPRFKVADKKWPKKVGEADLCLWRDDKLAALSLGVDDNFAGEIDWWKEQAKLYDFKVTWFLITGRILKEEEGHSYGGYWSQFQELEKLGHAVESHTVTHLHVTDINWGTPEWNYAKAEAARGAALTAARKAAATAVAVTSEDDAPAVPAKPAATAEGESAEGAPMGRLSKESLAAARLAAADKPATDPAHGIDWEYAHSIEQIENNIPGKKVSALGYPGGKNTVYNDRNVAAKYFRVARGATGSPNMANQIDYMSTNAMSGWDFSSPRGPRSILDPNLYKGLYYRGWVILFAHGVSAYHKHFIETFEFLKENRENLWIGLYTDVAKYGQERDTATLKVEASDPDKITLLLTGEMDDSYFNSALTVRVRVPAEWKEIKGNQGKKSVATQLIQHDGSPYALIDAVPDAGLVTLTSK